jgi:ribosomal-protein-alanine N-acetyltransferase
MFARPTGYTAPPPLSTRLVSDRLVLRPPRATDVPEFRRLLRDNADHLRPWSPQAAQGEDPTSVTHLSKLVLLQRKEWRNGVAFSLLVAMNQPGEPLIGRVVLNGVVRGAFHNAYLGYWIAADQTGQGLMREAVSRAIDFAFDEGRLHRIQAAIMPTNQRSLSLIRALGFRQEGRAERYLFIAGAWQDHYLFALTREEWKGGAHP